MSDFVYKPQQEKIFSEPTSITLFDKSRQKSNRSKADLFELLIVKELSRHYNLTYQEIEKFIEEITKRIEIFKDGSERVIEQQKRVKLLIPFLIKEIDKLIPKLGRPIKIIWIGRKWQTIKTLSDISINFSLGKNLGISIKSTRSGKGTQKNIGLKELKSYIGLNIDQKLLEMKKKIILKIARQNKELKEIAEKGMTAVKKNKYKFPVIQEIGKEFGVPLQKLAVIESVNCFNKLDLDKKKDFLNFIFGLTGNELLLNAFMSGKKNYIYWNNSLINLVGNDLKAVKKGDKGYYISSKDKNIVRIQVNFTNGIGISAFCERAFI